MAPSVVKKSLTLPRSQAIPTLAAAIGFSRTSPLTDTFYGAPHLGASYWSHPANYT